VTGDISGARRTSYAYFGAFISLGMFAGMLGPSLDVFKDRTGSTNGQIAILFTVMAIGYTVGGAWTGRLFDRRRGHPLIAAGLVGAAIAVLLMTKSSTLIALGVLMAAMGFSTSSVDAGGNTLLTWLHGDNLGPWMIGLHAAFGVGSASIKICHQKHQYGSRWNEPRRHHCQRDSLTTPKPDTHR
jgi:MFS transporter, FHS family, Na+ dependent glucose transporter 1